MEISKHQLFATDIYTTHFETSDEVNKVILEQLETSKEFHTESHNNNIRNENTYVAIEHVPAVQAILTSAIAVTSVFTKQQFNIDGNNWWFNVMHGGDTTNPHGHSPGPVWSGVYYVKVPAGSGKLHFTYNRMHIKEPMRDITSGSILPEQSYFKYIGHNFQDVEITPVEGMMVIFPSWLDHRVGMQQSNNQRVSISFNMRYPHAIL